MVISNNSMLSHYFKIAFRNIGKHWVQSLTGIFGLAFALACFIPAFYWMHYEISYDSFFPDADHIYRVYTIEKQSGKINKGASKAIEKKMREQFPSIEASTTLLRGQENCRTEEIPHIKMQLLYADSSFFHVFPEEIICGNTIHPLQVINNMVLTETMAVRLFGDVEKAIGRQVQTKMRASLPPYTVTAVVKDPPANTNLSFEAIIFHDMLKSFSEMPEEAQWTMLFMEVYTKFNRHANVNEVIEHVQDLPARLKTNSDIELHLMPIQDIRHKLEADVPFTLHFIGLFVASGILLLLTAIFNFFNLHLDLFRQRTRELHLRAVNGATGKQLILQMLFELICSILLALLLAACLVVFSYPAFSDLLGIAIDISQLILLFAVFGISILIGMISIGVILFWRLSRRVMRPQSAQRATSLPIFRRMAVTLQLFVSILFIVSAFIVMKQMNFINQKDLGFDREGLIQLSGFVDYSGKIETTLIQEISTIPQVVNITDANFDPQHDANPLYITNEVKWPGSPSEVPLFDLLFTDSQFAKTMGLTMVDGQWWDEGQQKKIVLNEEAVRIMGLSRPVGTVIRIPSTTDKSVIEAYEVAGVVNDFHTLSLRNRIQPTIFIPSAPYLYNILYIHTQSGQEHEVIKRIMNILPTIDSSLTDADLTPVSELYDRLNRSEQIGLKMFSILAIVCLLISLFGIYAVALASTQRRRKEIAIRKVVGAKVKDIIYIFFRESILQVILAGAFALPIAYLAMNNWLQGYAYRTNISLWLLLGVIVGVIVVVILTILGQVMKAANGNPAEVVKKD